MDTPSLPNQPAAAQAPAWRTRSFDESPALLAQAVALLAPTESPRSSLEMTPAEARIALAQMRLVSCQPGTMLFREGERTRSDHMLLLLEGEVAVDTGRGPAAESTSISVLGPGCVIGEMAMLDGAPRSASCTTVSAVQAAGMSRLGLERVLEEHPRVAAKLLAMLAHVTADRLRGLNEQLALYAQLNDQLRKDADASSRFFQPTV
jgi:CRP/FNR family transcriptional regulator, cyclic AMP receptor protein